MLTGLASIAQPMACMQVPMAWVPEEQCCGVPCSASSASMSWLLDAADHESCLACGCRVEAPVPDLTGLSLMGKVNTEQREVSCPRFAAVLCMFTECRQPHPAAMPSVQLPGCIIYHWSRCSAVKQVLSHLCLQHANLGSLLPAEVVAVGQGGPPSDVSPAVGSAGSGSSTSSAMSSAASSQPEVSHASPAKGACKEVHVVHQSARPTFDGTPRK
jgi:hypothetical protein